MICWEVNDRLRDVLACLDEESLMETIIGWLRDAGAVKGEIVACDATFIKAYSKRDPKEDSKG